MPHSVKTNPSIPIKSLIGEIKSRHDYSITYRKAWLAKQKALAMEFGDWENSYNELPRWLQANKKVLPEPLYNMVLLLMSWTMCETSLFVYSNVCSGCSNRALKAFDYYKPIVQVDDTVLTGKYHDTLLVAIAQDGNRNIFPLTFAILEGDTKEALIWFFQFLR